MKTVMKKLFSLMLVAALLVSVVPTAFAEGEEEVCTHPDKVVEREAVSPTCSSVGYEVRYYCSACNNTIGGDEIPIDPSAHNIVDNKCTLCGYCERCGKVGEACDCCPECECPNGGHYDTCTSGCTKEANCPWNKTHKDGCVSQHVCGHCGKKGHLESKCPELFCPDCGYALANNIHSATCIENCTGARDCPNPTGKHHNDDCLYALCNVEGCTKNDGHTGEHTGVHCSATDCSYPLGHDGKHSYQCDLSAGCQLVKGHTGTCSDTPEPAAPGKSTLKVFVNLYTADVKTKTYELTRYTDLSSKTKVYPFISNRIDELKSLLPNGYTWSGNVYDADNDDNAELMNKTVGSGRTVYINAYTGQDYVYIYVHNSRSYSNIRVIQLDGKKVGDNVSRSEVWKAVSKYYSLNSLKMFDEDGWEAYVKNDKTAQDVESLTVDSNIYEIHVRISGSSKSSGSTADSSNPKTGDAIFVPVMVLGVSASALAVLFYLNKKRAF